MIPEILKPADGAPTGPVRPEDDAARRVVEELNKQLDKIPTQQQTAAAVDATEPLALLTELLAKFTEMAGLVSGLQSTLMNQQRFIEQNHKLIHEQERRINQLEMMSKMATRPIGSSEPNRAGDGFDIPKGWPKPRVQFDTVLVPPEEIKDSQDGPGQQQEPVRDEAAASVECEERGGLSGCPIGEPGEPGPTGAADSSA
jgi:hypothetical protein